MSDSEVQITSHVKDIEGQFDEALLRALEICGGMAESYAKENLTANGSVDTGLLRNSITHAVGGEPAAISGYKADVGDGSGSYSGNAPTEDTPYVMVGTNVEYAVYVEKGTGKHTSGGRQTAWTYKDSKGNWHATTGGRAKPYLQPAVENHEEEYRRVFEEELKDN